MDNDKYIGRLLDNRYEILEVIGTGGMAVVYKARCHRLNRLVAIKILKDDLSQDSEFRRRFHAESQAVAMLSHPNIMSVYDVSTTEEADYIVMELIDGITLKQYMEKKGVLNWKETLHFAMLIAKALEHAHSRGIVHRDIKPHNVMVLKNGSVKVTDFGIARIMSKSNTLTKEALGSVHYISPEQAKGGRVDNRSDLYSLGVVMYEMMTGRAPYDGESPVAVAIQHINGGAPMPSTLNPNIPGGLEQIIMRLMEVDPNKRYPTASALLYDMEEFRKDPTILFDFNDTPVDDAVRIQANPVVVEKPVNHPPRNTAERVAGTQRPRTAQPGQSQQRPRTAQNPNGQRTGQNGAQRQGQNGGQRPQQRPANAPRQGSQSPRDPASSAEAQRRAAARQERREQEESRTRTITIAVIACSLVAVVAIVIFLVMLLNGGLFGNTVALKNVPNLIGQVYADLDRSEYPDFEITLGDYEYSEYEAGVIIDQTPDPDTQVGVGSEIKVYVSQGPEQEALPVMEDLSNTTEETAKAWLDSLDGGLIPITKTENHDTIKEGRVTRTEPAAGEPLTRGQTVTIYLSSGPEVVKEKVPNVVGLSFDKAVTTLAASGFKNYDKETEDSTEDKDQVLRIAYRDAETGKEYDVGSAEIDVNSTIVLYISSGKVKEKVPDVEGKSYNDAVSALNAKGFKTITKVVEESKEEKDKVLRQSVSGGTELDTTQEIVLYVSEGVVRENMPNVLGMTVENAKKTLSDAGFNNVTTTEVESSQAKGTVYAQNLAANTQYDVTTQVVLSVSMGPKVTKKVTIELPTNTSDAYQLIIKLGGETIVTENIEAGTPSITVDMVGRGSMDYEVLIEGIHYKSGKVDFDS